MKNSNAKNKNSLKNKTFFEKATNFLSDIIGFIQYRFASNRNYYPCKFIGEKSNEKEPYNTIILYRMKGKKEILETPIKELLENIKLLVKFHQKDAVRFGAIAMGDTLFRENKEAMRSRFDEIKRKMLDSTNSIQGGITSGYNYYPCKLVGNKSHTKEPYKTIILYTIKGKREVFEVPIIKLLEDAKFLEKFHPTTAVKFGAIAMGDALFGKDQNSTKQKFDEIKQNMLDSI